MANRSRSHIRSGTQGGSDAAPGYRCNGVSEWSHVRARCPKDITLDAPGRKMSAAGVILVQRESLEKYERTLRTASAQARPKLEKSIAIKRRFIRRLEIEIEGSPR